MINRIEALKSSKKIRIVSLAIAVIVILALPTAYIVRKEISIYQLNQAEIPVTVDSLFDYIDEGNYNVVNALLNAGVNVNARKEYFFNTSNGTKNVTPLMASISKQTDIVKLLIDKGADVNLTADKTVPDWQTSALTIAVSGGDASSVEYILSKKVNKGLVEDALEISNIHQWSGSGDSNTDNINKMLSRYLDKLASK